MTCVQAPVATRTGSSAAPPVGAIRSSAQSSPGKGLRERGSAVLTLRHPTRTWPRSAFADAIWLVGPVCLSSLLAAGKPQGTHSLTPPIINYASSMCVQPYCCKGRTGSWRHGIKCAFHQPERCCSLLPSAGCWQADAPQTGVCCGCGAARFGCQRWRGQKRSARFGGS